MASGSQGIAGDRKQREGGRFVGRWSGRGHQPSRRAFLVRTINQECDVDQPLVEKGGRRDEVVHRRGAAGSVTIGEAGMEAVMLRQAEAREHVVGQAAEQPVDFVERDAGVFQGQNPRLGGKLDRAPARHRADSESRSSNDCVRTGPPVHRAASLTAVDRVPSLLAWPVRNNSGATF